MVDEKEYENTPRVLVFFDEHSNSSKFKELTSKIRENASSPLRVELLWTSAVREIERLENCVSVIIEVGAYRWEAIRDEYARRGANVHLCSNEAVVQRKD